jgi:Fe-S-cluster containining protein
MRGMASQRASPPVPDAGRDWGGILREMHAEVDRGLAGAIRREEKRRGRRLACRRGCDVCCRVNTDIPVYPLELAGISRHCVEGLDGPLREAVRERCAAHVRGGPCPFLVDGACAVHPVRPVACRLLAVFGERCAAGEDAWHARRADVLAPPVGLIGKAYRVMLPFHGVTKPEDQEAWLARGLLQALVRNLPELEWGSLAALMTAADRRPAGPPP